MKKSRNAFVAFAFSMRTLQLPHQHMGHAATHEAFFVARFRTAARFWSASAGSAARKANILHKPALPAGEVVRKSGGKGRGSASSGCALLPPLLLRLCCACCGLGIPFYLFVAHVPTPLRIFVAARSRSQPQGLFNKRTPFGKKRAARAHRAHLEPVHVLFRMRSRIAAQEPLAAGLNPAKCAAC
jgi:hypothetical protein